jgi:hypothetical protein
MRFWLRSPQDLRFRTSTLAARVVEVVEVVALQQLWRLVLQVAL